MQLFSRPLCVDPREGRQALALSEQPKLGWQFFVDGDSDLSDMCKAKDIRTESQRHKLLRPRCLRFEGQDLANTAVYISVCYREKSMRGMLASGLKGEVPETTQKILTTTISSTQCPDWATIESGMMRMIRANQISAMFSVFFLSGFWEPLRQHPTWDSSVQQYPFIKCLDDICIFGGIPPRTYYLLLWAFLGSWHPFVVAIVWGLGGISYLNAPIEMNRWSLHDLVSSFWRDTLRHQIYRQFVKSQSLTLGRHSSGMLVELELVKWGPSSHVLASWRLVP
jgi:hypothetical protein